MGVQEAAQALTTDIRREVNWFVEPGHKQFVDPVSLSLIALGLMKLFATSAVTAAGAEAGKLAVDYVRDLIVGRRKVEANEVETTLAQASGDLAKLTLADAAAHLGKAQARLADEFADVMPRGRADGLASAISAAATPLLQSAPAG